MSSRSPAPARFITARRTAWLTRHHAWPDGPTEGVALFTRRSTDIEAYRKGLISYGLGRIETL